MSGGRAVRAGGTAVKTGKIILALVAVLALAAAVFFTARLPGTPELLFQALSRVYVSPLDIKDNGVSDYYPVSGYVGGKTVFAVSIVPDVPASYAAAVDFLRYLNRDHGVSRIALNISEEAAELLNSSMTSAVDDGYYVLTEGHFCSSREFADFVSDVAALNSALLPSERISFVAGSALTDADLCADSGRVLFVYSRSEVHGEAGLAERLEKSGAEYAIADVLCCRAVTTGGLVCSDIVPPLLDEGCYLLDLTHLSGLSSLYVRNLERRGLTADGFRAVNGPCGDFCFITAGSRVTEEEG